MDEVDGLFAAAWSVNRGTSPPFLRWSRGDALQGQRVVRSVHVGGQVGFGVEHLPDAGFEPFGIYVQFPEPECSGFGSRVRPSRSRSSRGRLSDTKALCQLFLRHPELLPYQFYPFVHGV